MGDFDTADWLFSAVLLAGYLAFVYVLGREVWFGLRFGRTAIYWQGRLLSLRKVVYARDDTPLKFRLALAANMALLIVALTVPVLLLRGIAE